MYLDLQFFIICRNTGYVNIMVFTEDLWFLSGVTTVLLQKTWQVWIPKKLHTTDMRMLRWARGNTKKDHIKNEDIWREANIESMTIFLR